jgi:hypothetical protein
MKATSIAVFVLLFATPAVSLGIDMSSMTPSLWYPDAKTTSDVVSKDSHVEAE